LWNSPNVCACIVCLHNEERVCSAINKTFQEWKINITSMWPRPANIYFVMWLTDRPTDRPTDRLTCQPTGWWTDRLIANEREENPYLFWLSKYELFFSHTIIKKTDHASFVLLWSYTASRMAFSTPFLTWYFLISTTVCIYGLISLGLAFVVSKLGMILQVCTSTVLLS